MRTKQRQEIDFVIPVASKTVHAIECKWTADAFVSDHLRAFRKDHPHGKNWVVCSDAKQAYFHSFEGLKVEFVPITAFRKLVALTFISFFGSTQKLKAARHSLTPKN